MKRIALFFSFIFLFSGNISAADKSEADEGIELRDPEAAEAEKVEDGKVVEGASHCCMSLDWFLRVQRVFYDADGNTLLKTRDKSLKLDPNAPKPKVAEYGIEEDIVSLKWLAFRDKRGNHIGRYLLCEKYFVHVPECEASTLDFSELDEAGRRDLPEIFLNGEESD